jgi:Tfp pilus assembly protein PilX
MYGNKYVGDSSGSALVIVLLILIALTILGFACIHSGIIELKITSNERQMRQGFYLAESAAMDGIQRLSALNLDDMSEQVAFWHHSSRNGGPLLNFRDPAQWVKDGDDQNANCVASAIDPDAFIAVVEHKVATASSLVMTDTRLYQNRIYGFCTKYGADNLVEIGFNLRY